jgi:hypothetical protein
MVAAAGTGRELARDGRGQYAVVVEECAAPHGIGLSVGFSGRRQAK